MDEPEGCVSPKKVEREREREMIEKGGLTVFRCGANEANRSRNDATDQQFVVEDRRSTLLVWVNLHVLLSKTLSPVVSALPQLPPWLFGLGEEQIRSFRPVWPRRFDRFEIRMRVPLDSLLLGEALFLTRGVLLALLFVAEIRGHGFRGQDIQNEGRRW